MKNKRIFQFDYLKAASILAVIITHITFSFDVSKTIIFPFFIDMAVPVFMIISGYVNADSFDKKSIRECYSKSVMGKKIVSISVPYIIFYVLEIIGHKIYDISFTPTELLYGFFTGGWGKGSYYVFLQFQLLLVFPLLLLFLQKTKWCGVGVLVLLQAFYQYAISIGKFENFYRLCILRCMIFVLAGIMLYWYGERIKRYQSFLLAIIGFLLVIWVTYDDRVHIIFPYRSNTSMPTVVWAVFLVYIAYEKLKRLPGVADKCIMKIGKSTLWILFVQILYYRFLHTFQESIENEFLRVIVNCLICCGVGIVAKDIEELIKKKRGKRNESYRSNTGTL